MDEKLKIYDEEKFGTNASQMAVMQFLVPILIIVMVIFLVTQLGIPFSLDPEEIKQGMDNEKIEQSLKTLRLNQISMGVRTSEDCRELQDLQLELISKGADSENWPFLLPLDSLLEIAEKRYDVLC